MTAFSSDARAKRFALLFLFTCMLCTYSNLRAQTGYTSYLVPGLAINPAYLTMDSGNANGFTIHGELDISSTNPMRERYAFYIDSAGQLLQSRKWDIMSPVGLKNSDVTKLHDGYLDAMLVQGNSSLFEDIFAVKTDGNGNIIWSNQYMLDTNQNFWKGPHVARLSDNTYVIASDVNIGFSNTTSHYFVMRLDSSGNVMWANGYLNIPEKISLHRMDITRNDDILVTGGYYNVLLQAYTAELMRVDKSGNLLWARKFQYNQLFSPQSVYESPGDSIWMVTQLNHPVSGLQCTGVMKLDSAGQVAWARTYWHPQNTLSIGGSIPTHDSGIVIFGEKYSPPKEAYLLKLDAQGNQQWLYTIPNLRISDITTGSNGSIRYVGTDTNMVSGMKYGELVPGSASACATLQPPLSDSVFTPMITTANFVIPIPITRVPDSLNAEQIISGDSIICNGLVGLQQYPGNDQSLAFELIPNPAGESVRISGLHGQNTIRLYNSRGQLCMNQISRSEEQWIDLTPFAEGLYFITIDNGEKRSAQKLVIQR